MTQNTIFARTPKWILRDKSLSLNAKAVYGALMLRADNVTLECWPSRQTLADDLGTSDSTVKRSLKELEECGAIVVFRRKRKGTKENDTNRYRMIFDPPQPEGGVTGDQPRATGDPTGGVTGDPVTRPIQLNPVTKPTPYTDQQVDPPSLHAQASSSTHADSFGFTQEDRRTLRQGLQSVGEKLQEGYKFYDPEVWPIWDHFIEQMETVNDGEYQHVADYLHDYWTVSAKVADPYEAGIELNKIIHTANMPRGEQLQNSRRHPASSTGSDFYAPVLSGEAFAKTMAEHEAEERARQAVRPF